MVRAALIEINQRERMYEIRVMRQHIAIQALHGLAGGIAAHAGIDHIELLSGNISDKDRCKTFSQRLLSSGIRVEAAVIELPNPTTVICAGLFIVTCFICMPGFLRGLMQGNCQSIFPVLLGELP